MYGCVGVCVYVCVCVSVCLCVGVCAGVNEFGVLSVLCCSLLVFVGVIVYSGYDRLF